MEKDKKTEAYWTVNKGGHAELDEKKSRFLASVSPAQTEEEALAFIGTIKKKYGDARHNCYAFAIGRKQELTRCSDDGEPSQTAGRPILEVLLSGGICNAVIVVTRYFGGTLLGTGGLIRAYTKTAQAGLAASEVVRMRYGVRVAVTVHYNDAGRVQYILEKRKIAEYLTAYTEQVKFTVLLPAEEAEAVKNEIEEATGARAGMEELERLFVIDKKESF